MWACRRYPSGRYPTGSSTRAKGQGSGRVPPSGTPRDSFPVTADRREIMVNTAERAALEHENWIAYLTGVVRCSNAARVHRADGAVTILSDIPFDWFNQVLIERPDATQ